MILLIVSESKKLTCSSAIGYVVQTVLNRVMSVLPKNEVCYPTGIGYDANGYVYIKLIICYKRCQ